MADLENKNYYEVLEIPTNATDSEIQQGYIRSKNAYAQESLALYSLVSEDECRQLLTRIEEAHSILSDSVKRARYDHARGIKSTGPDEQGNPQSQEEAQVAAQAAPRGNISRIVASKRFSLNYEENPIFEEEIANATDYSGEFLSKIREYKKVDINRMADMTRVSKTYLRNIENESLENLPALVYVRGFIYQYAKCLKLNPELVADSYINRIKDLQAQASGT